jgi:CBS domain-containing protein
MDRPNEARGTSTRQSDLGISTDESELEERSRLSSDPASGPSETWSPKGDDFSSSDAPIGQGSNTPVGDEPTSFRDWNDQYGESPSRGVASMLPSMDQGVSWGAGAGIVAAIGGLIYAWWRRRQARRSRVDQLRDTLMAAGLSAGADLPKKIGHAAGKAQSPWLPFALLPLALLLQSQGRRGERASKEMLKPLKLEDRSVRLAREASKLVEKRGRHWIRENDPTASHGWSWTPWLVALPVAGGGAYLAARKLMGSNGASGMMPSARPTKLVRDVMTRGVEVVNPDATAAEAARKMRDLNVGSLPVCDGQRLLGMVTDRDLSVRAMAEGKDPNSTPVRQVMSPEITWVFEDEPAEMAARTMRTNQIRRLPVLDRTDKLVGIVALGDLATEVRDDALSGETLEKISEPSNPSRR